MRALQLYTAGPLRARLDGTLTRSLLPEVDPRPNVSLEFDTSSVTALQEDADAVHARARMDWQAGGLTFDEYRQRIGSEPVGGELGESILLGFSSVLHPITAPLPGTDEPPPPPPADELEDDLEAEAEEELEEEERGELTLRAAIGAQSRVTVARIAGKQAKELRRFWVAQGDRIIALTTRSYQASGWRDPPTTEERYREAVAAIQGIRAAEHVDWNQEARLLERELMKLYDRSGLAAWKAVAAQLGIALDWDLANPNVGSILNQLATRITGIHATTRTDVRRLIGEALDQGSPLEEIAARLRTLFRETYRNRAMTVARTETMVAYNQASVAGYQASERVAEARLLDNPRHTTDPGSDGLTCAERNGLVVPLSEVGRHIDAEHPNGTLAVAPVLTTPLGE
jgi:hypothetical protein